MVAIEGVIVTVTVVLVKCEGSVTARVGLKLAVGSLICPQTSTAVMFIVTLAILLQGDSKVAKVLVSFVCGMLLFIEVEIMYCFIVNKLLMKFGGSQSISRTHVPGRSNGNSVAAASFGTAGGSENTVL